MKTFNLCGRMSSLHSAMDVSSEEYNWHEKSNISHLVAESIVELIFFK